MFPFPDTPLACGLAGVAIGAEDLALRNLVENGGPREARPAHICDVVALIPQMIELEDYGIAFAADDARVLSEVLPHAQLVLIRGLIPSYPNVRDVFLTIAFVPQTLVFNEAALAPRVTDSELRISEAEFVERLLDLTSAAGLHLELHRTCILSFTDARNNHMSAQISGIVLSFVGATDDMIASTATRARTRLGTSVL
jgi:hypothetical protein